MAYVPAQDGVVKNPSFERDFESWSILGKNDGTYIDSVEVDENGKYYHITFYNIGQAYRGREQRFTLVPGKYVLKGYIRTAISKGNCWVDLWDYTSQPIKFIAGKSLTGNNAWTYITEEFTLDKTITASLAAWGDKDIQFRETCDFDDIEIVVMGEKPTICGNNIAQPPIEQCDGSDLAGATCITLGYASGTLSCNSSCAFDVSKCMKAESKTCTDTDNPKPSNPNRAFGIVYTSKGTTTGYFNSVFGNYIDYCKDTSSVYEYYCTNSTGEVKRTYAYNCTKFLGASYVCEDGACINKTAPRNYTCADYDFNCDGKITLADSNIITDMWKNGTIINVSLVVNKTIECKYLGAYLGDLWKQGVSQINMSEVVRIAGEVKKCEEKILYGYIQVYTEKNNYQVGEKVKLR